MEKGIIKELIGKIPQTGTVELITIRPERRALPGIVSSVTAKDDSGLEGDHFSGTYSKKRQVTLIQSEHLEAVASMLHVPKVDPLLTRRNIIVRGINLLALKDQKFTIGKATFRGTGLCYPCSRMEENLGPGGYNAMRGHGGITAEVLVSGKISNGDTVQLIEE